MKRYKIIILILFMLGLLNAAFAQKPYRVGTTAADFLAIGFGSAGAAMGDAYVSVATDLSSVYWNPAGLSYMEQNEAQFIYQPWIADISTSFTGVGIVLPNLGTFSLTLIQVGYGEMEVTNLTMQEGTGEMFSANDFAVSLSFARRLANWFAFGASGKYISSQIWHTSANAFAVDLGVIVNTQFFSPTGKNEDGMNIGMSISNYGTRMKYDGMDLLQPVDIAPNEQGNYSSVPGKFSLQGWELPLIFRIGVSVNPLVMGQHRLTLSADALHPNNNMESVNIGAQYNIKLPPAGDFYLRGGYKSLFLEDSEYGFSFGGGVILRMMHNIGLKVDYAYRGVGILGKTHCYTIGVSF
ncbi:PorV/PorQ family protein [candidate division KSB1 bacterium]|nr:PorV/PorQ family protein [candidate division KSB1 bacterium]